MPYSEEQMRIIEERISEHASQAIRKTFIKARELGRGVTVRVGDDLVELRPEGEMTFLKKLSPKVPAKRGKHIKLQ